MLIVWLGPGTFTTRQGACAIVTRGCGTSLPGQVQ